jgi:hypothetical protein
MKHPVQQLGILFLFLAAAASPASAADPVLPHQDIRSFLPPFIRDTAQALDQEIKDKTAFVQEFFGFKEKTDAQLGGLFDGLSGIVKDYAENKDGLEGSSQKLFEDIRRFSAQLNTAAAFPRLEEVQRILEPHVKNLAGVLEHEFPVLGPIPAQGFPLGNFYTYFQEAEARDSFGMGAFFRIEPLRPFRQRKTIVSKINYVNEGGVEREQVIYEEVQTFENDERTSHRLVKNDQLLINETRREDFSFLHGLPKQMRADRMNERFIRLVEEYVKLVNYHLIENYQRRGLVIPADHPQLAVPAGYTPETFIRNFIGLILAIQTPGPSL